MFMWLIVIGIFVIKKVKKMMAISVLVILLLSMLYLVISYCIQEPYAFKGARISYSITGSEKWTETYVVKDVCDDTMVYVREIHYINGTWINQTFKECVKRPVNFPAVPQSEIGAKRISLLNNSFQLVEKRAIIIDNCKYTAFEYVYGKIGVIIDLFIESQTGIVLNGTWIAHGYRWYFQLISTNIKPKNCIVIYTLTIIGISIATITVWLILKNIKK